MYLARGGGGAHKVVLSWVLVASKESVCPQLLTVSSKPEIQAPLAIVQDSLGITESEEEKQVSL